MSAGRAHLLHARDLAIVVRRAGVVANVGNDMVFGIEAGAPRDGGAIVTFTACPFTADYPEQREGQPPTSKIKIDNVNRELVPKIRAALGVREYIQVLYREYHA